MRTADMYIKSLGVYLPDSVSIEQAVAEGRYPAEDVEAHQLTGAAVAGEVSGPEMALSAAQDAFKRCGIPPEDIDLLLYTDSWHQGPDGWQPQYYLQRYLLGGDCLAVETRHGCNGAFSALELAASYLRADDTRTDALVVTTDNFGTPMVDRWRMGPGYVLGDAACAVVLSKESGFAQLLSVASIAVPEAEEVHRSGEAMFPPGPTVSAPLNFTERTADFNRRAIADGTGTGIWLTVHTQMLAVVDEALADAGIELGDITRVAYMNYSKDIVEQRCMAALGLPMSMSTWEFGRGVGHLAASDQLVSLDHLLTTGELGPGDHFLMIGVGPGITVSSAVVRIVTPPPWTA
ncbi:ketoacyl-ACP synthase III family protein [Actinocrispum wychmicini]|uniref:3-oxoacyl-[acyl-carrier-protein] synthase-3/clorobiocin biosynthesis protein CloN2 n=1 Tax=Actinocrispum wychmicini TaxID=1213861 RepID=A0A4R2JU64_9PSEU|nr:ketoacyl-ACP synthase III family protein [Actinocrispum wychmicini]TCO60806.1 3-oxoacyl-[acyl-carrier-protein] synthase-3/clorobiocin biosynthesis protein CloN2 [Actinocrispum wychmicini]